MKIAVMQPYLFPYIGYFQLINAVDKFIIYDDVNFIKQGWINRNQILVQGAKQLFTVPLQKQSSFLKINETFINEKQFEKWKVKFLKTIEQSYKKAPYFEQLNQVINKVLSNNHDEMPISKLATKSLLEITSFLGLKTEFVLTSSLFDNVNLSGQERILDICKKEQAEQYINLIGGIELYNKQIFKQHEIKLNFINTKSIYYKQFNDDFVPWLSIIDILMFNSVDEIRKMLNQYTLT
ncbi:WbqC-like protein [Lutibacter oceani]|uniref:WbqC-like protein n=1 Tax=Lutibacter oceani TaxID=1853311 RepID=A0A3D9RSZ7_9FLAO|nr:WbqC family protein [Lutibacter oceani]REE83099.1 WbqC-like protein [Lutibacter oceani]